MSGGKGTPKEQEKLQWQQVSPGRTPDTYIRYRRYGAAAAARWRWLGEWYRWGGSGTLVLASHFRVIFWATQNPCPCHGENKRRRR
ncbi:Hypp3061 [Branchiostoma lanceolatum]|uniref:Hypp3061 protein n=1 Tax=Branchiostoma lanceolatum TaxID=7740 RepID=A0A8J9ZWH5_BRALA|nr:Hypp3061 [Branchiostoma lanceolatum]